MRSGLLLSLCRRDDEKRVKRMLKITVKIEGQDPHLRDLSSETRCACNVPRDAF